MDGGVSFSSEAITAESSNAPMELAGHRTSIGEQAAGTLLKA